MKRILINVGTLLLTVSCLISLTFAWWISGSLGDGVVIRSAKISSIITIEKGQDFNNDGNLDLDNLGEPIYEVVDKTNKGTEQVLVLDFGTIIPSEVFTWKITVLNKNTITNGDNSLKELETIGEVEYFDLIPEDEVIKVAENSDVIITNKTPITARIMDECKNLKFVSLFATGYNNIDIEYAKEKGIVVSNVPGYSTDAVAQHTFAFILELALNLSKYNSSVMAGDWAACDKFCYFSYPLMELKGKTLGIKALEILVKRLPKSVRLSG